MNPRAIAVFASFLALALAPAATAVPPSGIVIEFQDGDYTVAAPPEWRCTKTVEVLPDHDHVTVSCLFKPLGKVVCGVPLITVYLTDTAGYGTPAIIQSDCGDVRALCEVVGRDFCIGTAPTVGGFPPWEVQLWAGHGTSGVATYAMT